MRFRQWIKNLIVFMPLYFGHRVTDIQAYPTLIALFFVFCFVSSATYLFNDICDRESDRLHPTKRNRPIASGRLKIPHAYTLIAGLIATAALLLFLSKAPPTVYICVGAFLVLNLIYSLRGKHWPVFDAFFVSAGFLLRTEAGGFTANVNISPWLFLIVFFLSLLLAFGKRLEDMRLTEEEGISARPVIAHYSMSFLITLLAIISAVLVVVYTLYTVDADVIELHGPNLYFTVPLVALGLFYYLRQVIVVGESCDPTNLLLRDRGLQLIVVFWLIVFTLTSYYAN